MIDLQSSAWAATVRDGLGATWHQDAGHSAVACFHAGPFRMAYPDFFSGSENPVDEQSLQQYLRAAKLLNADLVRVQTHSLVTNSRPLASHIQTSCIISSLEDWNETSLEKVRRTANREKRSALLLRQGRGEDARYMHSMYLATIRRHGGAPRYTKKYFELIAPHAATVAELDGKPCGFVCTGWRHKTAYYMHGAHDIEARKHYVSDLLFLNMIRQAKAAGMVHFDFLPSPANQASLLAYKRLWGAADRISTTHDFALKPLRARCLLLAMAAMDTLSTLCRH